MSGPSAGPSCVRVEIERLMKVPCVASLGSSASRNAQKSAANGRVAALRSESTASEVNEPRCEEKSDQRAGNWPDGA